MHPANAWGDTEHLLAVTVDLLASANWQRAGDKKRRRPKPIERPGDKRRKPRIEGTELADRLLAQRARHTKRR